MKEDGFCSKCKCSWRDHVNSNVVYRPYEKKVDQDDEIMKAGFETATKGMTNGCKEVVGYLSMQIRMVAEYRDCKETLRKSDDFLRKFAIEKRPYQCTDYIEQQITLMDERRENKTEPEKYNLLQSMLKEQRSLQAVYTNKMNLDHVDGHNTDSVVQKVDDKYFEVVMKRLTEHRDEILKNGHAKHADIQWWERIGNGFTELFTKTS